MHLHQQASGSPGALDIDITASVAMESKGSKVPCDSHCGPGPRKTTHSKARCMKGERSVKRKMCVWVRDRKGNITRPRSQCPQGQQQSKTMWSFRALSLNSPAMQAYSVKKRNCEQDLESTIVWRGSGLGVTILQSGRKMTLTTIGIIIR